jgi:hypothetical protein
MVNVGSNIMWLVHITLLAASRLKTSKDFGMYKFSRRIDCTLSG